MQEILFELLEITNNEILATSNVNYEIYVHTFKLNAPF